MRLIFYSTFGIKPHCCCILRKQIKLVAISNGLKNPLALLGLWQVQKLVANSFVHLMAESSV